MTNLLTETQKILKKYNIKPRKRLGQNFLIDSEVLDTQIIHADLQRTDIVLEIGPGKGIITDEISNYCKVIGIEKDSVLASMLDHEVIEGDALEVDFPKFNKIISNIPFQISSPLTFRLFKYKWDVAILIYQKEFAKRFVAKPGDKNYSRLTVAINYYCNQKF